MSDERQLLIDYKTICQMLSIGRNLFFTMRQSGRFPIKPIRLGGSVRYNRREVERWVEAGCPANWKVVR
jgi:predicted DNA-binding transcriptional regulator AlpA